jgi:hypothetical protein
MKLENFDFITGEIVVDPEEILHLAGNREGTPEGNREGDLDRHTRQLVDEVIGRCREVSYPQGGYAWFKEGSLMSESVLELNSVYFRMGKIIAGELNRAEEFVLFAVTPGPGPESLSRDLLQSGNYLEGYLADLTASVMAEALAGHAHAIIKALAGKRGMKVTNFYSPGYCSWEVREQQKLFSLLPHELCGITLSDSSLMSPVKSVSGLIGIGSDVKFHPAGCTLCSLKHCQFRNQPAFRN